MKDFLRKNYCPFFHYYGRVKIYIILIKAHDINKCVFYEFPASRNSDEVIFGRDESLNNKLKNENYARTNTLTHFREWFFLIEKQTNKKEREPGAFEHYPYALFSGLNEKKCS